MSNSYAPGYPINTNPGPVGDTVKGATEKHIAEFLKAYADLSAMYQQILVEIRYADVDMVDGKHADNTPNNIPILNSNGELTTDINNEKIKTDELTVSGTASVGDIIIGGNAVSGLVSASIKINTGVVKNGDTIPLPTGFTQEQCAWFVIPRRLHSATRAEIDWFECRVDENRVVTIIVEGKSWGSNSATYIIIGIK